MTTNLFINDLLHDFNGFIGVFTRDNLPVIKPVKSGCLSLVVNTNSIYDTEVGHWLLISFIFYEREIQICELFDSLNLGLRALHEDIYLYIKRLKVDIKYNYREIQSVTSNFCGFFCICRFLSIFISEPLTSFLSKFEYHDLNKNDALSVYLIKQYLNVIKVQDS